MKRISIVQVAVLLVCLPLCVAAETLEIPLPALSPEIPWDYVVLDFEFELPAEAITEVEADRGPQSMLHEAC